MVIKMRVGVLIFRIEMQIEADRELIDKYGLLIERYKKRGEMRKFGSARGTQAILEDGILRRQVAVAKLKKRNKDEDINVHEACAKYGIRLYRQ